MHKTLRKFTSPTLVCKKRCDGDDADFFLADCFCAESICLSYAYRRAKERSRASAEPGTSEVRGLALARRAGRAWRLQFGKHKRSLERARAEPQGGTISLLLGAQFPATAILFEAAGDDCSVDIFALPCDIG